MYCFYHNPFLAGELRCPQEEHDRNVLVCGGRYVVDGRDAPYQATNIHFIASACVVPGHAERQGVGKVPSREPQLHTSLVRPAIGEV